MRDLELRQTNRRMIDQQMDIDCNSAVHSPTDVTQLSLTLFRAIVQRPVVQASTAPGFGRPPQISRKKGVAEPQA